MLQGISRRQFSLKEMTGSAEEEAISRVEFRKAFEFLALNIYKWILSIRNFATELNASSKFIELNSDAQIRGTKFTVYIFSVAQT